MVSRWYFPCLTSMCWRLWSRRTPLSLGSPRGAETCVRALQSMRIPDHHRTTWLQMHCARVKASRACVTVTLSAWTTETCSCFRTGVCRYFPHWLWQAFSLYSPFTCRLISAYVGRGRFRMMIVGSVKRNDFSISSPGWLAKVDTVSALTYIVLHGKSIGVTASLQLSSETLSFMTNSFCTAAPST